MPSPKSFMEILMKGQILIKYKEHLMRNMSKDPVDAVLEQMKIRFCDGVSGNGNGLTRMSD
jgi:hypothetical protein